MRVLLLQTGMEIIEESYHDAINAGYPLGLAYIHSYLEAHGHDVQSLDHSNSEFDAALGSLQAAITAFQPHVIGLQILTCNRVSSFRTIEHLAKQYPEIRIVVGGIHVTELYAQILFRLPTVLAVLGEGEQTFLELLDAFSGGRPLDEIRGIAFRKDHKTVVTQSRMPIDELDRLPFPKHEAFVSPTDTYASLLTSRGCPFTCSFCAVARREVRFRSVANVVDEIEYIAERLPQVHTIRIWDDQFFYKPRRVVEICDEIVRRGISLRFICMGRLKPCTREMVLAMERAGFVHVLFGLETGSPVVAEKCNKGIRPRDAVQTARLFRDSTIEISMFLIVGLQGETAATIRETAEFVQELQAIKYFPGWSNVGIATIYPGTDLYASAKSKGLFDDSYWISDGPVPLYTAENSHAELQRFLRLLEESVDPLMIFESHAAFIAQRHLLPQVIRYCLRMLSRQVDSYWNRKALQIFANHLGQTMQLLEQRGQLSVKLGGAAVRTMATTGLPVPSLKRKPGSEMEFVYEVVQHSRKDAFIAVLDHIAEGNHESLFATICQTFEELLLKRFDAAATAESQSRELTHEH